MPLVKGHSKEVVSENIKRAMKAGSPQKQAIAIALTSARRYKKMAEGGMVDPDYDAGDASDFDQDAVRGLNELRIEGKFQENENASPKEENDEQMLARALQKQSEKMEYMALGGLVEDPEDPGTEEPSVTEDQPTEEPMFEEAGDLAELDHPVIDGSRGKGLTKEQMEAIADKKKKRRFI